MKKACVCLSGWIWVWVCTASPLWAVTYAYIPNYATNTVTRVATNDLTHQSIPLEGGPYGAAVSPDGSFVLVTCHDDDTLALITPGDFNDGRQPVKYSGVVGAAPTGVAIAPNRLFAYVTNFDDGTVSRIDLRTMQARVVSVGRGPWGVAAIQDESEGQSTVYVANADDHSVSVIVDDGDPTVRSVIANVGQGPTGVAVTPDGRYALVANHSAGIMGTVTIIRTRDDTIVRTLPAGRGPWGMAVGAGGDYAYVTNSHPDGLRYTLTAIRISDLSVLRAFLTGPEPLGVAAPRNGDFVYAINGDDTITRVDIKTLTVTTIHDVGIGGAYALGAFIGGRPPERPSRFNGRATSYDRIELSWVDNSTDALGFRIERRKMNDAAYSPVVQVPAGTTTYIDYALSSDTRYEYRILAYNEAADSDYTYAQGAITTEEGGFSWCFIGVLRQ